MWKLVVLLKTLFMAACAVTIFGVVIRQLRRLDPFLPAALPSWMTVGGLALMVVGAILSFACFGLFSMSGALSRHAHFPDPEVFITWGPYRYVRNPMTKGGWTVLCGWASTNSRQRSCCSPASWLWPCTCSLSSSRSRSWSAGSGRVIGSTSAGSIGGSQVGGRWQGSGAATKRKGLTQSLDRLTEYLAKAGIEPPTRGFSVPRSGTRGPK